MNEHTPQEHRQDYFDLVEQELREAIRSGAHLRSAGRAGRVRWTARPARAGWTGHATRLASAIHPRSRPPIGRVGLALASVAAVAATAIVIFTVGLGAGTQQAFAGWSAHPLPTAKGQRVAAVRRCKTNLRKLWRSPFDHSHGGLDRPPRLFKAVAVDVRGPYTLALLFDGDRQATCFTGPSRAGHPFGAYGLGYSDTAAPAAGKISGFAGGITTIGSGRNAYTYAVGRAGAGVEGVTLLLANRRRIVTTTEKGWFLAWWPGSLREDPVTAAEVKTASGTHVQRRFFRH